MANVTLHGFFRSSTSFRVRIALNLKGVEYDQRTYVLRQQEHRGSDYLAVNPQGLVPSLVWSDGTVLTQSMAIIEFLDEVITEPALLPKDPAARARVRGLTQVIGCDVHPLNNLRVLQAINRRFGADEQATKDWFNHWAIEAFEPMEEMLAQAPETGRFCHGDQVSTADIALVSQVINNRRFEVPLQPYPTIERIFDSCMALPEFRRALPENQPDAK